MKKIFLILIFLSFVTYAKSETPYFVDFKYILNESAAEKSSRNIKIKIRKWIEKFKEQRV